MLPMVKPHPPFHMERLMKPFQTQCHMKSWARIQMTIGTHRMLQMHYPVLLRLSWLMTHHDLKNRQCQQKSLGKKKLMKKQMKKIGWKKAQGITQI